MLESPYKNTGFVNSIVESLAIMLILARNYNGFLHDMFCPSISCPSWKWPKSGSGAPGPESAPRGTKSTTFATEIFQPSNFRNSFLIQYGILRFYTSNVRHTFKTKLKLEQHSELEVGTIWAASGDASRNWESKHRGMQLRMQKCM